MNESEFGTPGGGSVIHDAPARARSRTARRLLTLFGLAIGCWLLGMIMHAATASAAPTDELNPAGTVATVQHVTDSVITAKHDVEHTVRRVVNRTVTHAVPIVHRTAHRATGVVRHVVRDVVDQAEQAVQAVAPVVRPVVDSVVRPAVHHLRPTERAITAPVTINPAQAAHLVREASPTASSAVAPGAASVVSHAVTRTSAPAAADTTGSASLTRSPDPVPPFPAVPQPLPVPPGGGSSASGAGSGDPHLVTTLSQYAATRRQDGRVPSAPAGATPAGAFQKRPGFSPD